MMRYAIILLSALALSASAQTSNVQRVKAWTRTYIMGVPGGQVLDPTGKSCTRAKVRGSRSLSNRIK